jgi:hypothetical protein
MNGKYAYALNEDDEVYNGSFDTEAEAVNVAFNDNPDADKVFVSICRDPIQPEDCVDAGTLIDEVINQEDYFGDPGSDYYPGTKETLEELTSSIRKVFAEWLDKHNERPSFWICDDAKEFTREEWDKRRAGK